MMTAFNITVPVGVLAILLPIKLPDSVLVKGVERMDQVLGSWTPMQKTRMKFLLNFGLAQSQLL